VALKPKKSRHLFFDIEKGCLTNSIYNYLANTPLPRLKDWNWRYSIYPTTKTTRSEALNITAVQQQNQQLNIRLF
jgi:hypothetical protein